VIGVESARMNWLRRLNKKQGDPTQKKFANQLEAERALIRHMRESGTDLTHPKRTTHYLYFQNEDSATQAAAILSERGFTVEVRPPFEKKPDWSVIASHDLILSEESIGLTRSSMESVAAQFNGEYDGWELKVQPKT
jgi:Regulator of ribonuclease activity B